MSRRDYSYRTERGQAARAFRRILAVRKPTWGEEVALNRAGTTIVTMCLMLPPCPCGRRAHWRSPHTPDARTRLCKPCGLKARPPEAEPEPIVPASPERVPTDLFEAQKAKVA